MLTITIIFNNDNKYNIYSNIDYKSLFIQTLFECIENKEIRIDKDSYIFEKYILNWEQSKKENYKNYIITQDSFFEFILQELGYFGCVEQMKYIVSIFDQVKNKRDKHSPDYEELFSQIIKNGSDAYYLDIYLRNPNVTFEGVKKEFFKLLNLKSSIYIEYIFENINLDFEDLQKLTNDKNLLIIHPNVTIEFMENNIDIVRGKIKHFTSVKHIPLEFYFKHNLIDNIILYFLLLYRKDINVSFLEKCIDKFGDKLSSNNWNLISQKCNISSSFIKKYKLNINFKLLGSNPYITDEIIKDYPLIKNEDINSTNISQDMFLFENFNIELYKNFKFSSEFLKNIDHEFTINEWDKICQNININQDIFEYRINKFKYINWYHLCQNSNISECFFEKYINLVNWSGLCQNSNISECFFEKYIQNIDWESLTKNTNISSSFFDKYYKIFDLEYNCWKNLSNNYNMDIWFFIKHLDRFKIFDTNLIRNPLKYGKVVYK